MAAMAVLGSAAVATAVLGSAAVATGGLGSAAGARGGLGSAAGTAGAKAAGTAVERAGAAGASSAVAGWVAGWPTTAASVLLGESLAVTVKVQRGSRQLVLQRRQAGQPWEALPVVAARRAARIVIAGDAPGRWRYRLTGRVAGRAVHTAARTVRIVDPNVGSGWMSSHYAAGDLGDCGGEPEAVAGLLPDGASLLALGDIAYPKGRPGDLRRCYLPHYGRLIDTTRPVPGNHEYFSGAQGYFALFAPGSGTRRNPWYAWEDGPWRFLMLNSNCTAVGGCDRGSRQYSWVQQQLRDHPRACLAAAWHAPVYSSGKHGNDPAMKPVLRRLVRAGADIVLNGHDHSYERFARMGVGGPDPDGARQFVVGTGGADLYEFTGVQRGSEVRYNSGHGVLRLVLADGSFRWEFLAVGGGSVDTGTDTCS